MCFNDLGWPRVRAGIIGCGRMGAKHLRVLNENPEIELVAACDVSPQRLGEIPHGFVPDDALFERYEEMFERVVLDLVVVVTPPTVRVSPVTEALQRGISVLCEKPLAIDLASADRMVEAAGRSVDLWCLGDTPLHLAVAQGARQGAVQ